MSPATPVGAIEVGQAQWLQRIRRGGCGPSSSRRALELVTLPGAQLLQLPGRPPLLQLAVATSNPDNPHSAEQGLSSAAALELP